MVWKPRNNGWKLIPFDLNVWKCTLSFKLDGTLNTQNQQLEIQSKRVTYFGIKLKHIADIIKFDTEIRFKHTNYKHSFIHNRCVRIAFAENRVGLETLKCVAQHNQNEHAE